MSMPKFLGNTLCAIEWHRWGKWEWDNNPAHTYLWCKQVRTCLRCGITQSQQTPIEHNFSEWVYQSTESCKQERTCNHCGYKEENILHLWEDWKDPNSNSCEQIRICKRNGCVEKREIPHTPGEWAYVAERSCEQTSLCIRCNKKLQREIHDWELLETRTNEIIGANYYKGAQIEVYGDVNVYKCTRCGCTS